MSKETSGYSGVIAAQITPCRKPGIPDPDGMLNLSRILVNHGCHGLFVLGSTGELPLLDEDQRRELVAAAREGAGEDAIVFAGVSGCGVKQVIRYTLNAEKDGADAAVIMAPFFLKFSQYELMEYIRKIADASPIPVGIYNHLRMPSVFNAETLKHLVKHPNIAAIKDTDSELSRSLERLNQVRNASVSFFQGREPYLYDSFLAGADGCVTALANIAPELHRQLYEAVKNGNNNKAKDSQKKIDSLSRIFQLDETKTSFAGFSYSIRKVLEIRGWLEHSHGMIPGFKASEEYNQKIHDIVDEAGLLSDN